MTRYADGMGTGTDLSSWHLARKDRPRTSKMRHQIYRNRDARLFFDRVQHRLIYF